MRFEEILSQSRESSRLTLPDSWAQGRTIYGGLSAALLCDSMSRTTDRSLRYLKTGFLKPLVAEKPFEILTRTVSEGRTLKVSSADIIQDDVVRVTSQAHFVAPLDSSIEIDTFNAPELKPFDCADAVVLKSPPAPACIRYFDIRVTTDSVPFGGGNTPELGGWMRFQDAPEQFSAAHLVCAIDSWPPAPSTFLKKPAPMSTISWGIHFAGPAEQQDPNAYLGYLARINFFKDGFGSSTADIWNKDGRLLAKSYQTFVVYA